MKLLIAIPSKSRPYQIAKDTVRWLKDLKSYTWKVFVEPDELIHYELTCGEENCIDIGENNKGLGYVTRFIGQYAINNQYDLVFFLNDDMPHFISKKIGKGKSGYTVEVVNMLLEDIIPDISKDSKIGAVRITGAMNHIYEMNGKQRKYTHKGVPLYHAWIVRPKYLAKLKDRFTHNNDTIVWLYIHKDNCYTLNYGLAAVSYKDGKNSGGLQMFDRNQLTKDTFNELIKEFPDIKLQSIDRWYKYDINIDAYKNIIPL